MEVVDDEESQQSSEDGGYEELNEDDGKSSDEDSTPKNRKRRLFESYPRKRVTEACIPCKERHLKCDSKQPCLPCSKRKVPCIYAPLEIRKKRGRKPVPSKHSKEESASEPNHVQEINKNTKLDTKIRVNTDRIPNASSSSEFERQEPKELPNPQQPLGSTSSFVLSGVQSEFPIEVLQTYSIAYHIAVQDLFDLDPLPVHLLPLITTEKVSTVAKLHWFCTLAIGAQILGSRQHSYFFASQSRNFASQVFDTTSPIGASCLGVLAYYYEGEQDFERSNYFYGLSRMMCEVIIAKKENHDFKVNSFCKSLLGCASYTSNTKEMIDFARLARFVSEVSVPNFAMRYEVSGIVVMSYQTSQPVDYERLLKHLEAGQQRCEKQTNKADQALLKVTEARILRDLGKYDLATAAAGKALELVSTLDKLQSCSCNSIFTLGYLVAVTTDMNLFEMLQTAALKLLQLGSHYNFAMYILKAMLKCKGFENIPPNANDFLSIRFQNCDVPACGYFISELNATRSFGKISIPEVSVQQQTNQQESLPESFDVSTDFLNDIT